MVLTFERDIGARYISTSPLSTTRICRLKSTAREMNVNLCIGSNLSARYAKKNRDLLSRNTEFEEKVAQMEKAAKIQRDVAAVINERATAARDFQKNTLAQVTKHVKYDGDLFKRQ